MHCPRPCRLRLAALAGAWLAGSAASLRAAVVEPAPAAPARAVRAPPPVPATADWPVFRHDLALTGVTQGKGTMKAPRVLAEHYLGAPFQPIASAREPEPGNVADLDGDGVPERFHFKGKTITVSRADGKDLWSFTVDGLPLGGNVRAVKLFPDRPGLQVISFSSRMDTGDGQGYCFSFHRGAERGELAWTTGPLTGQHSPTLIVDDLEGDSLPEVVAAPHYRLQVWNGQTGALKAEVPWDVGRNYGILLSRPRQGDPHKDVYIVCDFVLHVDRLGFRDGKLVHAWGHKYFEPNQPVPRGREMYIRVGPNPVCDLDGDGRDEMAYMLVDAAAGDVWRLRVRDAESGAVEADLPGLWLWSIADLDGDGAVEVVYTPTERKRPPAACDLYFARLRQGKLEDLDVLRRVQPILMDAALPPTAHTIADEGLQDLLRADLDGDGRPEVFHGLPGAGGGPVDRFAASSLGTGGKLERRWAFERPGHRLNLIHAGPDGAGGAVVRVRDLTAGKLLEIDRHGKVASESDLGRPGGFSTTPIAVDLDGDGVNEVLVQEAGEEIAALRFPPGFAGPPRVLWRTRGVAMNPAPGYYRNGALSPQAADLDGDGRPEVVFAVEDAQGWAALACAGGDGKVRWTRSFPGCPWGGLQAGVNLWTFGRFSERDGSAGAGGRGGLDVYVDVHRRSKGSSEGFALRGDTGEVLWHRRGLEAAETAMPFGGGLPAVADLDGNGRDDLAGLFWTIYGAMSGSSGDPLHPPAFLWGPKRFGKWIAYSSPTLADLDGDGRLEAYLNSASNACGGFAAVEADGQPMWMEARLNDVGPAGFGPVGDLDGDGKTEVAVATVDGRVHCLRAADGSRKWEAAVPAAGDVVAGDLDSDGVLELVLEGKDGRMRALSASDGREVWSVLASGRPIIADADGDGLVEVLAAGGDGLLRVLGEPAGPRGSPAPALRTLDFASDPRWEGFRNRLVPSPAPITRQDFGHRPTRKAGGKEPGEVGGRIQRSLTPAWYAKRIPEKTLKDRLSASGRFAVRADEGGSGVLFGWFHETSRGWRASSALVFRIDGNGGHHRLFYEYGTRSWLTGGGGAFEGERWQDTPTPPLLPDGSSHLWSLEYDPEGSGGRGELRFELDGQVYRQALVSGHKEDGATFNRFGIFNLQITGGAMEVYFDDLVLDGRAEDLTAEPGWEARGITVEFEDRVRRPFHDFGWSPTSRAGGAAGEVGGIVWRDEAPAWYAGPVGPLTLEDELRAGGKVAFTAAGSDSAVYLGWFNAASMRSATASPASAPAPSFLAVLVEGPSRVGHWFRPAYRAPGGEGKDAEDGPLIRPDGGLHRWSITYSPREAAGRGRITVTLDGETRSLDIDPGHRARGASFDRFGLFNMQRGGHFVEIWIDDLSYRAE